MKVANLAERSRRLASPRLPPPRWCGDDERRARGGGGLYWRRTGTREGAAAAAPPARGPSAGGVVWVQEGPALGRVE